MHNPVQNIIIKSRIFRRRHKSSVIWSVVAFLVLFYFVVFQNLVFLQNSESADLINNPDRDSSIFKPLLDVLAKPLTVFSKKKTVPFVKTDAAESESKDKSETESQSIPIKVSSSTSTPQEIKVVPPNDEVYDSDFSPDSSESAHESTTSDSYHKHLYSTDTKIEKPAIKVIAKHPNIKTSPKEESRLKIGYRFYEDIFNVLHKGKPKIPELRSYLTDDRIYHARYDSTTKDENVFSEYYLSQFLQLNETELASMKDSHNYVMENLPESAPKGLYSGDGIVYVGGGKFNWLTLLSIKSIRVLGCNLPIEVLIPKADEYEKPLCETVFPSLGAKCIYLPYALQNPANVDKGFNIEDTHGKKERKKFHFEGYQYKALAILLSSFENVLLLDSDNVPVHSPEHLFKKDPFISSGLIVWPDFWKRATSPDYYKIAGLTISETQLLPKYDEVNGIYHAVSEKSKRIEQDEEHQIADRGVHKKISTRPASKLSPAVTLPLHQRQGAIPDPTSESGQLMISKKTHIKPLLLALYYNLYGPSHFYPLFSQGSDGEGDKETFLAATIATNKKYYQVAKFLNAFGYFNLRGDFEGTGMGQYDPVEDYEYSRLREATKGKSEAEIKKLKKKHPLLKAGGPRILFVHANWPKLNPWQLKITRKIFNEIGQRFRLYGTGMKLRTGDDFELVQWQNMKHLLCDLNIQLDIYKNVIRSELCKEIDQHLDFLRSTADTLE